MPGKQPVSPFPYLAVLIGMLGCGAPSPPDQVATSLEFENTARPATASPARDPRVIVRASGMIALAQVETDGKFADELVIYSSHSGGDFFDEPVRVDPDGGKVVAHGEGSPIFLQGPHSQFHVTWVASDQNGQRALMTSRSKDFLRSFDAPITVASGGRGEPAFFDAAVAPDGRFAASWLARPTQAGNLPGTSNLIARVSQEPGKELKAPVTVATDVCPCCSPALIADDDSNLHVAWRTTDAQNVRSMAIATSTDHGDTWSEAIPIPELGWKIKGCPHSGPTMAVHDGILHVAWYSEAHGSPRLYWSRQESDGTFQPAMELSGDVVDANHPFLGTADGRLFATFQGRSPDASGSWPITGIYISEITGSGALTPVEVPTGSGSASYPQMSSLGASRMLVAWTEQEGDARRAMVARARIQVP